MFDDFLIADYLAGDLFGNRSRIAFEGNIPRGDVELFPIHSIELHEDTVGRPSLWCLQILNEMLEFVCQCQR